MDNRINAPASQRVLAASRIACEAEDNCLVDGDRDGKYWGLAKASELEAGALALIPANEVEIAAGGELVPKPTSFAFPAHYADTVRTPSLVTAEANRSRLDLASEAGVLETTLDLCDTIQAQDSAERMLAAQMALMHRLIMKTGRRADEILERLHGIVRPQDMESYTVQLNRLVGTVARASGEYQNGLLTLSKKRSGGKQNITVTHVQNTQVNSGGQAVVTGGTVSGGLVGTGTGGPGGQGVGGTNGKTP